MLIRCPHCRTANAKIKKELDKTIDLYQCCDCKKDYYVETSEDKLQVLDIRTTKHFILVNR